MTNRLLGEGVCTHFGDSMVFGGPVAGGNPLQSMDDRLTCCSAALEPLSGHAVPTPRELSVRREYND
jgi:hypothetical protein